MSLLASLIRINAKRITILVWRSLADELEDLDCKTGPAEMEGIGSTSSLIFCNNRRGTERGIDNLVVLLVPSNWWTFRCSCKSGPHSPPSPHCPHSPTSPYCHRKVLQCSKLFPICKNILLEWNGHLHQTIQPLGGKNHSFKVHVISFIFGISFSITYLWWRNLNVEYWISWIFSYIC